MFVLSLSVLLDCIWGCCILYPQKKKITYSHFRIKVYFHGKYMLMQVKSDKEKSFSLIHTSFVWCSIALSTMTFTISTLKTNFTLPSALQFRGCLILWVIKSSSWEWRPERVLAFPNSTQILENIYFGNLWNQVQWNLHTLVYTIISNVSKASKLVLADRRKLR